jgi:hypothetical protein
VLIEIKERPPPPLTTLEGEGGVHSKLQTGGVVEGGREDAKCELVQVHFESDVRTSSMP